MTTHSFPHLLNKTYLVPEYNIQQIFDRLASCGVVEGGEPEVEVEG